LSGDCIAVNRRLGMAETAELALYPQQRRAYTARDCKFPESTGTFRGRGRLIRVLHGMIPAREFDSSQRGATSLGSADG